MASKRLHSDDTQVSFNPHHAQPIAAAQPTTMIARIALFILLLLCPNSALPDDSEAQLLALAGQPITAVLIEGNRVTREHVVYRELRTTAGQVLDVDLLTADVQRLENLDIFSSIRVRAERGSDGLSIVFTLREIPFAIPYLSSNVTDEDGWSFGPALKSVNMLGRDISIAGYALFGGKTTFFLDLDYPWIAGNHFSFHVDLGLIERLNELDNFNEKSFELSPSIGTYIGERGRAHGGFSYYRFSSKQAGHTLTADRIDHLLQLHAGLGYDSRDRWGDPHIGWLNEVELRRTGGPLPGDGNFWTGHIDLRRFQPIRPTHTLVAASLLSLQSGHVGVDLPEYMDYHLGGSNTIRGYDIQQLGKTLYGKNQWLGTLEYRVSMLPRREYEIFGMPSNVGLSAALFADGGIAWNKSNEFDRQRLHVGWGLGLRILAPAVDMMRFDVGFDKEGSWRIHIASFSKMRGQRLRLR